MEQQAAAETAPQTSNAFSPAQITTIKNSLIQTVTAEYMKLCNVIRQTPCHPNMIGKACDFLDTGILWMMEGIRTFDPALVQPIPQPIAPETPTTRSEPVNEAMVPVDAIPKQPADETSST